MVAHENGGFVSIIGKKFFDPRELVGTEFALDLVHVAERIEEDPVRQRGLEDRAMFPLDRRFAGGFAKSGGEVGPIVVIAEGEMHGQADFAKGIEDPEEGRVVAGLAVVVSAVSVDDDAGEGLLLRHDLGDDLAEMIGHVDALTRLQGRVGGDVGVGEQRPRFRLRGPCDSLRKKRREGEDSSASEEAPAREGIEVQGHVREYGRKRGQSKEGFTPWPDPGFYFPDETLSAPRLHPLDRDSPLRRRKAQRHLHPRGRSRVSRNRLLRTGKNQNAPHRRTRRVGDEIHPRLFGQRRLRSLALCSHDRQTSRPRHRARQCLGEARGTTPALRRRRHHRRAAPERRLHLRGLRQMGARQQLVGGQSEPTGFLPLLRLQLPGSRPQLLPRHALERWRAFSAKE